MLKNKVAVIYGAGGLNSRNANNPAVQRHLRVVISPPRKDIRLRRASC